MWDSKREYGLLNDVLIYVNTEHCRTVSLGTTTCALDVLTVVLDGACL